jgi:acyl dehydratase
MVVYLPGAEGVTDAGVEPSPLPSAPTDQHDVVTTTHGEQSRDYAAVSGDDTSFHVNDAAARSYGFSGVILHGLCTLATAVADLTTRLGHGPEVGSRVAARVVSPAYPGEDLLVGYSVDAEGLAFRATDSVGRAVLERARVALR